MNDADKLLLKKLELQQDLFEANAQLARMQTDYVVSGIDSDYKLKVQLRETCADITAKLGRMKIDEARAKIEARTLKTESFMKALCRLVIEEGHGHLVADANAESLAALEIAGMADVYKSNVRA